MMVKKKKKRRKRWNLNRNMNDHCFRKKKGEERENIFFFIKL